MTATQATAAAAEVTATAAVGTWETAEATRITD